MLEKKNILIFGGDFFLMEKMVPLFKNSGANLTWINSSDVLNKSGKVERSFHFDDINTISSYDKELSQLIRAFDPFDGVIFALSVGSLRPLSLTKYKVTSNLFSVNCASFVELIRILQKNKKINEGSSVVAYSSISSLLGLKTKLAYAMSKAALNAAIVNLAIELAPKKIRVNGILKGAVTTDLNYEHVKNMFAVGTDEAGNSELGMTTPEELAHLTMFLLSDNVQTMTGSLMKLDGGYSLN